MRRVSPWWLAAAYGVLVFLVMVGVFWWVGHTPPPLSVPLRTGP